MDVHFLRNLLRDGCDTMVRVSVLAVLQIQYMNRCRCSRGVDVDVAHIELICSTWNCNNSTSNFFLHDISKSKTWSSIILNMWWKKKKEQKFYFIFYFFTSLYFSRKRWSTQNTNICVFGFRANLFVCGGGRTNLTYWTQISYNIDFIPFPRTVLCESKRRR